MSKLKLSICAMLITFSSCASSRTPQNAVLIEKDSPAIGENRTLVEDIGIETLGGVFTPWLRSGCATPCTGTEIFSTAQDKQSKIQIGIFRGREGRVAGNRALQVCYITDIKPAARGIPQIEVTIETVGKDIVMYAQDNKTKAAYEIGCEAKAND